MPTFYDRRTGELKDVTSGSPEHLGHVYGTGREGFNQMFPGETSEALAPWQGAGGLKHRQPYEQPKVSAALRQPESSLVDVDPRNLKATQPSVTRAGVDYYMGSEHRRTGRTWKDQADPGNRYPVIYGRTHPVTGAVDNLILSGHHRATAALLSGQFLRARYVEGGFGEER